MLPTPEVEEEIRKVPDVNDPKRINYWVQKGNKIIYIEGWSDACLLGTGFPSMEKGGTVEKVMYMKDMTPKILEAKAKEKGLKLLRGGFAETEDKENLYGVTWGVFEAAMPAAPPGVPVPSVPAAPPAAHGSMYQEYRKRISEVTTIAEINDLAAEIFDIVEREEYGKLTKGDVSELLEDLRKMGERRAMKLAEIRIPELKPKIRKVKPAERGIEGIEGIPFLGVLPPQIMHRYSNPDIEESSFAGERFIIDHELVRTIIRNNLLLFPLQWYALPSAEKIKRFGWDLPSAFKHAVEYLHKFSWDDLTKDYGIPKKYVEVWKKAAS